MNYREYEDPPTISEATALLLRVDKSSFGINTKNRFGNNNFKREVCNKDYSNIEKDEGTSNKTSPYRNLPANKHRSKKFGKRDIGQTVAENETGVDTKDGSWTEEENEYIPDKSNLSVMSDIREQVANMSDVTTEDECEEFIKEK